MLTSVLLHVGGLITVIIVSIVISIFSSRKKEKKRASFFSQFMPPQEPADIPADMESVPFMTDIPQMGQPHTEPSYSEIFCDDMSDEDDWIERKETTAERQHVAKSGAKPEVSKDAKPTPAGKSKTPSAGNRKPMAAVDDSIPESEYSLKNLDDAKRAIVYSEILKRKYC